MAFRGVENTSSRKENGGLDRWLLSVEGILVTVQREALLLGKRVSSGLALWPVNRILFIQ